MTWRCRATADPEAAISWQKDGVDVTERNDVAIARNGSELTVLNLRPDDAGRYMCVAANYVGKMNGSAVLLVIGAFNSYPFWFIVNVLSVVRSSSVYHVNHHSS